MGIGSVHQQNLYHGVTFDISGSHRNEIKKTIVEAKIILESTGSSDHRW